MSNKSENSNYINESNPCSHHAEIASTLKAVADWRLVDEYKQSENERKQELIFQQLADIKQQVTKIDKQMSSLYATKDELRNTEEAIFKRINNTQAEYDHKLFKFAMLAVGAATLVSSIVGVVISMV